jgi:hypothetical protein
LTSASTTFGPNGTTAHAAIATVRVITGASTNKTLSAPDGMMISLNTSFMPSAIGCSKPSGPTRLGPMRTCM